MEDYQIGICSLFLSVLSYNMFMDVIGRFKYILLIIVSFFKHFISYYFFNTLFLTTWIDLDLFVVLENTRKSCSKKKGCVFVIMSFYNILIGKT
jgi:hypothetical protein